MSTVKATNFQNASSATANMVTDASGNVSFDGLIRLTCTADYPEFKAWLAEGNTPLPADEAE